MKLSYSWKTQIRYISNIWPIFTELGVLCIRVHHLYIFHIDDNICYNNYNNSMMKTTSVMMTNSTNNEWCDYFDISIIPSVLQYLHTGIKICVIAAAVFVNDGVPNNYDDHFQFSWFDLDSNYMHNRYRHRKILQLTLFSCHHYCHCHNYFAVYFAAVMYGINSNDDPKDNVRVMLAVLPVLLLLAMMTTIMRVLMKMMMILIGYSGPWRIRELHASIHNCIAWPIR